MSCSKIKILFLLTYYRPHISGLTIYVERLAEALAARGHQVTVLTSHYARELPYEEELCGVRIVRAPVWGRISKGVIMPGFAWRAVRLMRKHHIASVQLPQLEAGVLAVIGRYLVRRPVVLTYHCDLRLPAGWFNRLVDQVVRLTNLLAGSLADRIVAYTGDYADNSRFLSRFRRKVTVIPPPVVTARTEEEAPAVLVRALRSAPGPVLGFAARLATEKGAEYLLEALEHLVPERPGLVVLFAGEYENVVGEEAYFARLGPALQRFRDHVHFLGALAPEQMAHFYRACDVLILPSINSTESFGLVQAEAMLCGTPVVSTDLPGVRQPVQMTGMGEIVPPRDPRSLADAIAKVLHDPGRYIRPPAEIALHFDMERVVGDYERLFERCVGAPRGDASLHVCEERSEAGPRISGVG